MSLTISFIMFECNFLSFSLSLFSIVYLSVQWTTHLDTIKLRTSFVEWLFKNHFLVTHWFIHLEIYWLRSQKTATKAAYKWKQRHNPHQPSLRKHQEQTEQPNKQFHNQMKRKNSSTSTKLAENAFWKTKTGSTRERQAFLWLNQVYTTTPPPRQKKKNQI